MPGRIAMYTVPVTGHLLGLPVSMAATEAMRWEILNLMLHQQEQKVVGSAMLMAPSSMVAAAVLFVLLDGGCTVRWAMQRSPLGRQPPTAEPRVRRLISVMLLDGQLQPWLHLPRSRRCPMEELPMAMRPLVARSAGAPPTCWP